MAGGAERRLAGELPVGRQGRRRHPEIINKYLGPDLPSLHAGERLEPANRPSSGPQSPNAPVPPNSRLHLDLKRQTDVPHARQTRWTV